MNKSGKTGPLNVVALVPHYQESGDCFGVVRAAASIAGPAGLGVVALIACADNIGIAEAAARAGASQTVFLQNPELGAPTSEELVAIFAEALQHQDVQKLTGSLVVLATGSQGEELVTRLSMRMNGEVLGRCREMKLSESGFFAQRSGFGGRIEIVISGDYARPVFLSMRPVSVGETVGQDDQSIKILNLVLSGPLPQATARRQVEIEGKTANIEAARILVSGGRGMKGAEGFAGLEQLANRLGGAVSCSLPVVDAGWASVMRQVGQSGKYVAPEIYLAVGISGTPQHMAGVGEATRIIAINSDPNADIFRFAEAGIVGEWQEIVPALISKL